MTLPAYLPLLGEDNDHIQYDPGPLGKPQPLAAETEPPEDLDAEDILDMAAEEMAARLKDPRRRKDIADHVLVKMVAEWNKLAERRATEKTADTTVIEQSDVLDIVRSTDLPEAKKRELIQAEIERCHAREKQLQKELKA